MMIGCSQVLGCPFCGTEKDVLSLMSGDSIGVFGSNAIRLLYVCPFRVNGVIWSDGISLLCTAQDGINHHLCLSCSTVSTFYQNRSWTHNVEHR